MFDNIVLNNESLFELNFKGKWRSYQQRVLDELNVHLNDKKLNVVAAPGAGKTTLGIEVIKRLNKPALILSPSITIKNQWAERIKEGFIDNPQNYGIVSSDIRDIKKITSTTYQSIHSIAGKSDIFKELIDNLKSAGVKTLVLDEAHHLRTEWYKTLSLLTDALEHDSFTIVSLTATPPYDVSPSEWKNYSNLCGPVDAEISIPELVKNGDLCPHQDLVYFCDLDSQETDIVCNFEKNRDTFFKDLKNNTDFIYAVENSAFCNPSEENSDLIYENTDFIISIISFLLANSPNSTKAYALADFLELNFNIIPKFDYHQAEIFFSAVLWKYEKYFENIKSVKQSLKELDLIAAHHQVDFTGENQLKNIFSKSKSKLDAILKITQKEYEILRDDLREVVLLDYIGDIDAVGLNVYSVFEKLMNVNIDLAVLTGSVIIVPNKSLDMLYNLINSHNINTKNVKTEKFNDLYTKVESTGSVDLVPVITDLFTNGGMKILIGTQALLGEGWDCPCTNTLIIASTIGSFMSSNQMRGRALRIYKNNPDKNSDIWHLAAIYKGQFNPDFYTVVKRFKTFEGVSFSDNKIKNGIERLNLQENHPEMNDCISLNKKMFEYLKERNQIKKKWDDAFYQSEMVESSVIKQVYDVFEAKQEAIPKKYIEKSNSQIRNFINKQINNRYENILYDEYEYIGKALYTTLLHCGIINNRQAVLNIDVNIDFSKVSVTLVNCTNYERNVFIKAFDDLFTINENTRYIIKKINRYSYTHEKNKNYFGLFNFFFNRDKEKYKMPDNVLKCNCYYFIPEIFAGKKANVEYFVKLLKPFFGDFSITYTKNQQGKKELLHAKYIMEKTKQTGRSRIWI